MNDSDNSKYSLQTSYFSFWQVMAFILVFAFIGSWVLRTFAGAPEIKSFVISSQVAGSTEFTAKSSKKPADDLVATNSCQTSNGTNSSSQTSAFSDWTLDTKTGYSGSVSFKVLAHQKCSAYVHTSKDPRSLANYSYTSL